MIIYISGPITGIANAKENFSQAYKILAQKYPEAKIINPFNLHPENDEKTWVQYMRADIKALMDCTHIYCLKGSVASTGACIEQNLAEDLGIIEIKHF